MKSIATIFTASLLATSASAFSGSSSFSGSQLSRAPASSAVLTMEYIPAWVRSQLYYDNRVVYGMTSSYDTFNFDYSSILQWNVQGTMAKDQGEGSQQEQGKESWKGRNYQFQVSKFRWLAKGWRKESFPSWPYKGEGPIWDPLHVSLPMDAIVTGNRPNSWFCRLYTNRQRAGGRPDDSDLKKPKGGLNLFGGNKKKAPEPEPEEPPKKNWWTL